MTELTAKQIEDEFGLGRYQLYRAEDRGQLTPRRTVGGQRRYDRAQIETFAKQIPPSPNGSAPDAGRVVRGEFGVSGLNRFSGSIFEEHQKELRGRSGRKIFREMRFDPVIAALFFALGNVVKQASPRVVPASERAADRQAAEFLESCLDDLTWSWHEQFDFVIEPTFEQGFSALEVVFKRRLGPNPPSGQAGSRFTDGRWGWRKWAPRPADTLAPGQEWIFDEHGGVRGINQQPDVLEEPTGPLVPHVAFRDLLRRPAGPTTGQFSVPIEKLLLFRTTVHPSNTPEPPPIHRPAYVPWYFTTNLQELEAIGAERDLAGIPVVYLGEGTALSGNDSDFEWAKTLVQNVRWDEQVGIVIPHPKLGEGGTDKRGVRVELLSTGGRRQWDLDRIVERYNKLKAVVVLAQFIMLGMTQVGSYALSRDQSDLFVLAVKAWLDNFYSVINRHAIPRLFALNTFPGLTGLPRLQPGSLGQWKLDTVAEAVNKLVQAEVLRPDPELERHLRQMADLPSPAPVEIGPASNGDDAAVDDQATVLRRLTLAMQPLEEMGILATGESMAVLRPQLDELKRLLGVTVDQPEEMFEAEIDEATRRAEEAAATGEDDMEKIVKVYVDAFRPRPFPVGTDEPFAKHGPPTMVFVACPACRHGRADMHKDHGGLCVCQGCGATFHPAFH